MKQHNRRRGIVASIGALVTAAALALGGAAAQATPFPIPESSDITITKLAQPATVGTAATGESITLPADAEKIGGVVFTAYEVPIAGQTKGTNAWQQAIANMTPATALTDLGGDFFPHAVTAVEFDPTDASGVTTENLDWGLYYVVETVSAANVLAAAPFLIAVPMTNPTGKNEWLPEIFVYPKNTKIDATKTVADLNVLETGEDLVWTVQSDVPRFTGEQSGGGVIEAPTGFVVTDNLDGRLDFVSAVARIVDVNGVPIAVPDQLEVNDYTVTPAAPALGSGDGVPQTVEVTLENDGLTKLQTAAGVGGQQVQVLITTKISQTPTAVWADGDITNQATVAATRGNGADEKTITVVTAPVVTKWHTLGFTKRSSEAGHPVLADADFQLFKSKANASATPTGPLANRDGDTTFTSVVGTGQVTIEALRASNFADGKLISDPADYQVYWLRETKAPAGHQLLAEPIPLLLMSDGKVYTFTPDSISGQPTLDAGAPADVAGGAEFTQLINVKNATGFALPLTGGMGTAFLTVIGVGILGFVVFMARRRRSEEAAN